MDGEISLHHDEIARTPLKKYFNLERVESDTSGDLDFILGWAEEKKIEREEDLMAELKKIEQRLGSPNVGENRITRIKNYLKADAKVHLSLREMATMERGWKNMVSEGE